MIYNGIDITSFLKSIDKNTSQKQDADTLVIISLGRLEFQKNQKFLIALAAELKRREMKYELKIGGSGSLEAELRSQASMLNVKDKVEFTGFIKDSANFINHGDIFVLPSFWEGFGYVLAEAALCQKPIVAFNCSSNPEVVIDGFTGYLTPVEDLNAFADKVQYLEKHPEKRIKMGQNGATFVQT